MWTQLVIFLISAVIVLAIVWHRIRWRRAHKNDQAPEQPTVAGVSAFTGELIATGQTNCELGDGAPTEIHFSP